MIVWQWGQGHLAKPAWLCRCCAPVLRVRGECVSPIVLVAHTSRHAKQNPPSNIILADTEHRHGTLAPQCCSESIRWCTGKPPDSVSVFCPSLSLYISPLCLISLSIYIYSRYIHTHLSLSLHAFSYLQNNHLPPQCANSIIHGLSERLMNVWIIFGHLVRSSCKYIALLQMHSELRK